MMFLKNKITPFPKCYLQFSNINTRMQNLELLQPENFLPANNSQPE